MAFWNSSSPNSSSMQFLFLSLIGHNSILIKSSFETSAYPYIVWKQGHIANFFFKKGVKCQNPHVMCNVDKKMHINLSGSGYNVRSYYSKSELVFKVMVLRVHLCHYSHSSLFFIFLPK